MHYSQEIVFWEFWEMEVLKVEYEYVANLLDGEKRLIFFVRITKDFS